MKIKINVPRPAHYLIVSVIIITIVIVATVLQSCGEVYTLTYTAPIEYDLVGGHPDWYSYYYGYYAYPLVIRGQVYNRSTTGTRIARSSANVLYFSSRESFYGLEYNNGTVAHLHFNKYLIPFYITNENDDNMVAFVWKKSDTEVDQNGRHLAPVFRDSTGKSVNRISLSGRNQPGHSRVILLPVGEVIVDLYRDLGGDNLKFVQTDGLDGSVQIKAYNLPDINRGGAQGKMSFKFDK